LSHCEHLGLVGIADAGDIGVDIELARPIADIDALAHEHFTTAELAALEATPSGQREIAFLRGWTRKEACLKAVGSGLTASVEVGLTEEPALAAVTTPHGRATVHMESVPLPAGALAAVARVQDAERDVTAHFGLRN
jgi:4'-phosphopantetheinyl transferase